VVGLVFAAQHREEDEMTNELQIYSIFHPDTIAPFQYFRVFCAKAQLMPEEKLMFAVLNDAIECLTKYRKGKSRRGRALYRDARDWILSKDHAQFFSFENICETLKIDPNYLHFGLLHWLEDPPAKNRRLKVWRQPVFYRNRIRQFGFTA
jgi:hypothetical protein